MPIVEANFERRSRKEDLASKTTVNIDLLRCDNGLLECGDACRSGGQFPNYANAIVSASEVAEAISVLISPGKEAVPSVA